MYESTPQHIIEAELVPGPASRYFDSSSSSDSDSSSSDSDSSHSSAGTRRRITRAIRRRTMGSRRSSGSNESGEEDAAVDTVQEGEGSRGGKKKHKKKKRKSEHSKTSNNTQPEPTTGDIVTSSSEPVRTLEQGEPKRVDFALTNDLESQTLRQPAPFSLRNLRPPIPKALSQNVFMKPTTSNESHPMADLRPPGIRRTNSMPTRLHHTTPSGQYPPYVPILAGPPPLTPTMDEKNEEEPQEVSRTTAVVLLLVSTGLVAICAEFMVDSINEVVDGNPNISEDFIGLILLPIIGNAAEHLTAVAVAMKNKMDLAIGVALGSSIQIAIFVTPLVVILGWILNRDMSLFFTLFETVSLFVSAFIVNFLVLDGRSNYLEGALLISAYVIIAVAAFFYPDSEKASTIGGGEGNGTEEVAAEAARLMLRGAAQLFPG
jgi:Ca2+:H+ antiporter